MDNFIDSIEINNFKSIRDLKLADFKRINLFIGRPNVGKSNILEALSLFSLSYVWENSSRKLTDIIRIENQREIFHDGNFTQGASIQLSRADEKAVIENCGVYFNRETGGLKIEISIWRAERKYLLSDELRVPHSFTKDIYRLVEYETDSKSKLVRDFFGAEGRFFIDYVKRYNFKTNVKYKEHKIPFLHPPFGSNMLYVLELMPELKELYTHWFQQYGLRLVSDVASQSLKILRDKGEEILLLPYSSVADTLQRIIFYKTAVASNENSVLLFEEPEAHAYPPYIVEFTQEVVRSLTNQFFIVTHSPLIVEEFLTDAIDDSRHLYG